MEWDLLESGSNDIGKPPNFPFNLLDFHKRGPTVIPAKMTARIDVVIGIVTREDTVLICRRPAHTTFPGYWEFPGGKREAGESLEDCLRRELNEELAIGVEPCAALDVLEHDYPAARIRLHPYLCRLIAGEPRPIACDEVRWVRWDQFDAHQFPPANESLLRQVADRLRGGAFS